jgi:hypothetical protein
MKPKQKGRARSPLRAAASPERGIYSAPAPVGRVPSRGGPAQLSTTPSAFRAQIAAWAARIRVKPRVVRLQTMRRKWASCSTRGTVSFNLELLTQPADFREYVIVHELLHLKVPNHGKLFKTLLRAYLPNYESINPRLP